MQFKHYIQQCQQIIQYGVGRYILLHLIRQIELLQLKLNVLIYLMYILLYIISIDQHLLNGEVKYNQLYKYLIIN